VWAVSDVGSSSIDRLAAAIASGFDSEPRAAPEYAITVNASATPAQGDRRSNARASTRDDGDWLHSIRLLAGDIVIGEV
jgi:hypothetical protein